MSHVLICFPIEMPGNRLLWPSFCSASLGMLPSVCKSLCLINGCRRSIMLVIICTQLSTNKKTLNKIVFCRSTVSRFPEILMENTSTLKVTSVCHDCVKNLFSGCFFLLWTLICLFLQHWHFLKLKIQSNLGIILFCTEPVSLKADIGEKKVVFIKTWQNILVYTKWCANCFFRWKLWGKCCCGCLMAAVV